MAWGNWILLVVASAAVIPALVLAIETFASLGHRTRRNAIAGGSRPRCAVLVPAHNEATGIAGTLHLIQRQLQPGDRLLVIADNCTDETASIARQAGAETLERNDPDRRGKGYALEFGLNHLQADPPETVVLIDADTRVADAALETLIDVSQRLQSPVQGVFTDVPRSDRVREQWSSFALTFKNLVRPLGLARLGMPCQLTGSGMAFPWKVIRKAQLGTGNIVEDMQLGIDLALAGHPARFCPAARFESDEAPNLAAAAKRRTRWEHGHVATLLTQAPRLLVHGIRRARPRLIGLALDLAVPPLSLLVLGLLALSIGNLVWWQLGGAIWPLVVSTSGIGLTILAVGAAWLVYGRQLLSLRVLCLLPIYLLWKIPIYLKMVFAREKSWVRTERAPSA